MKSKGRSEVTLSLTRDKLRKTYNLSPEMRLTWLEEANEFIHNIQSSIQRKPKKVAGR